MSQPSQVVSYTPTAIRTANAGELREVPAAFEEWTNHVPQSSVRSMAVHPVTNQIWLVSDVGLRAVDPSNLAYRRFTSEHGLPGNAITAIAIENSGRVWAAGAEGGLAYFEEDTWKPYPEYKMYGDLARQPVRTMCPISGDGGIYVATTDGIYRITDPDETAVPIPVDDVFARMYALTILHDADGLLLGNATGLCRIRESGEINQLAAGTLDSCVALLRGAAGTLWAASRKQVFAIQDDSANELFALEHDLQYSTILTLAATPNRLWVLASTGLFVCENDRWMALGAPDDPSFQIKALAPAPRSPGGIPRDDFLWIGGRCSDGDGFGGVLTDAGSSTGQSDESHLRQADRWKLNLLTPHQDDYVPCLRTRCLAGPDRDGTFWVGTDRGLFRRDAGDWAPAPAGGPRWLMNDIRNLQIDRFSRLWLLAYPQGVLSIENGITRSHPLRGIPTYLVLGPDGQPYCSTGSGVWRLDRTGWNLVANGIPGHITALAITQEGIWLGTADGLYKYTDHGWEPQQGAGKLPERQCGVHCVLHEQENLWVGTDLGLWRLHAAQWSELEIAGLASTTIMALACSGDSHLWLAADGSVMRCATSDGSVDLKWTPTNSGLGSKQILTMLEYENRLWIGTAAGLSEVALHTASLAPDGESELDTAMQQAD